MDSPSSPFFAPLYSWSEGEKDMSTPSTDDVLRPVSSPSMQKKSPPSSPRSFYSVSGTISSQHTFGPSSEATPTTSLGSAWSDNHANKPLPAQPGPDDPDLDDEVTTPAHSFLDLHPSSFTPFIGLPNVSPPWEGGLFTQRNNSSAKTALSAREVKEMTPLPVLLAKSLLCIKEAQMAMHYYQDSDFWQREYRRKCLEYRLCEQRLQLMTDRCKALEEGNVAFRGETDMGKEMTRSASVNHSLDIEDCQPERKVASQSRSVSPSNQTTCTLSATHLCTPRDSAVFDTLYEYHALREIHHPSPPNLALLHPCPQRDPFAHPIPFKGASINDHQSSRHPFSFDPPADISAQESHEQESAWKRPSAEGRDRTHPYANN